MPLRVYTSWGYEAQHPSAEDWNIDRDHDLSLYDQPVTDPESKVIAVYAQGQWLRVMHPDDPTPASAS
jgi:hypothetical protein